MTGKILMIEDEPGLVLTVGDRLEAIGYSFESSSNGVDGEKKALTQKYDLIILDYMLPGKDGLTICKTLRAAKVNTPILLLTARSQTSDKVQGLSLGADDYVCKPFDMGELLARVEALLRRSNGTHFVTELITILPDHLAIDLQKGHILLDAQEITLSAQEIKLLDYFNRHQGIIISREKLLNTVWGYESEITTRTIDVHVARLRQKMGDNHDNPKYIQTIRGVGYKFCIPTLDSQN